MERGNHERHAQVVRAENERRRLQREQAEAAARADAERRRLKLEWKLRRRENRRLYGLERQFFDSYLATADIDKDLINISNLDGSDSGGLKSVGLRGGLLGELFLLTQKLRRLEAFATLSADSGYFEALIAGFWASFVGDGFTVTVGVDPSLERNLTPHIEGISLDKLDAEAVSGLAPEEFRLLLEYLKIHFSNAYFDEAFPQLVERRDRRMQKVRFVEQAQPDDRQPPGDDPDDNKALEHDLNAKIQELDALFEQEPETAPELLDLDRFLDRMLRLLLTEASGLKGLRVTRRLPKLIEPPQLLGDDGEPREGPPVPRLFAVLLPAAPVPEEDLLPSPPPADAALAPGSPPKAPDSADAAPGDRSADVGPLDSGRRAEERAGGRAAAAPAQREGLRARLRAPGLQHRPAQERPGRGLHPPAPPQKPDPQVPPAAHRTHQARRLPREARRPLQ